MKQLLFTLLFGLLSRSLLAQLGQFQNNGFEHWSLDTLDASPVGWTTTNHPAIGIASVTESSESTDQQTSVQLNVVQTPTNQATIYGIIATGDGPSGISYSDVFNTIEFDYQCDLNVGDSARLIFERRDNGVLIQSDTVPFAFGTQNNWTATSIDVGFQSQDSISIQFTLGTESQTVFPTVGSWVRIDNVQLKNAGVSTSTIVNHSFEQWDAPTLETPDYWFTTNEFFFDFSTLVVKTTDAHLGNYAIELGSALYPDGQTVMGSTISVGPIDLQAPNTYSAPYNAVPTQFSGYYKTDATTAIDNSVQLAFYQGSTLLEYQQFSFTPQTNYTPFTIPLNLTGTPDRVAFAIGSSLEPGTFLRIDDLVFSGGDVGIDEITANDYSIYPNPATSQLTILSKTTSLTDFEIIDASGKILRSGKINGLYTQVDVSDIASGSYFIQLKGSQVVEIQKLIIR